MSENTIENLFVEATRKNYRYNTARGEVTTEELWGIPLENRNGFSLDAIAVALNDDIESSPKKSFVKKTSASAGITLKKNKLAIIQYIIDTLVAEQEAKVAKVAKESELNLLKELKAEKKIDELKSMSFDEIENRIKELS